MDLLVQQGVMHIPELVVHKPMVETFKTVDLVVMDLKLKAEGVNKESLPVEAVEVAIGQVDVVFMEEVS